MAKLDYEFDSTPLPPPPGDWGRRLRFGAIFLVISALTCGVIYLFIPESSKPLPPPVESVSPPTAVADAGEHGSAAETPAERPAGNAEGTVTPLPVETADDGEDGPGTKLPITVVETPAVAVDVKAETSDHAPTLIPEKGKPWIGDPAVDLPARPTEVENFDPAPAAAAIRTLLDQKKFAEAFLAAQKLAAEPRLTENSEPWREAFAAVTEANLAALWNGVKLEKYTVHVRTRPGDSFSRIAGKYHSTMQTVKIANRMPPSSDVLPLNRELVLYPGPWRIRVEKGPRLLKIYNTNPAHGNEQLFAVFDVGIGRLGRTPTADFVVSAKVAKPDWYAPDGKVIKYGAPENMLGEYFLKLAPAGTPDRPLLGYGIHGTPDESTVTKSLSNGCIRMRAKEIETLFLMIPYRTAVEIVD